MCVTSDWMKNTEMEVVNLRNVTEFSLLCPSCWYDRCWMYRKVSLLTCTDGAALSKRYVLLWRTFQLCAYHALTICACAKKQSCLNHHFCNKTHWDSLLEFRNIEELSKRKCKITKKEVCYGSVQNIMPKLTYCYRPHDLAFRECNSLILIHYLWAGSVNTQHNRETPNCTCIRCCSE